MNPPNLPARISCPVCGDGLESSPKVCPRCDTPHHPECWDYVPGCAVFACQDSAPPALSSWPFAHRLLVARARLTNVNAHALQAFVIGFAGAMASPWTKDTILPFLVALAFFGCLSFPIQLLLEIFYRFSPAYEIACSAEAQGDRHLRHALDQKAGSVLSLAPWKLAWALGMLACTPKVLEDLVEFWVTGKFKVLFGILVALPTVGGLVGAFFYPLLKTSDLMIGRQKILARRLEAGLRLPEKTSGELDP